jgi:hypothetical protein
MTEAEWIACTDPRPMLEALLASGRASERKLRLFAVACCRRVGHLLPVSVATKSVETAERDAEGEATASDREEAWMACYYAQSPSSGPGGGSAVKAAWAALDRRGLSQAAEYASFFAGRAMGEVASGVDLYDRKAMDCYGSQVHDRVGAAAGPEKMAQAALLRDICGPLPFRPLVLPSSVRTWDGGTVVNLAAGIYEERDFSQERMSVLADALEDAGCTDAELLGHLRGEGPHVRGCWVIDLLLGKS